MSRWIWSAAAAVGSGFLHALAFPPFEQAWLVWVALSPLATAVCIRHGMGLRRGAFLLGYAHGATAMLTMFHWVAEVSSPGRILLCLYLALYPGVWAWGLARFLDLTSLRMSRGERQEHWTARYLKSRSNLLFATQAAALWTSLEWLRGILFTGFGWNGLGISLAFNPPMIQTAEFWGVPGLSFLIAFSAVIVAVTALRFIGEAAAGRVRAHYDFSLTMLAVVIVFSYGLHRVTRPSAGDDAGENQAEILTLRVAAIQAAVPLAQRRDPAEVAPIMDLFYDLTSAASAAKRDLVIWPESAVPGGLLIHRENYEFTRQTMALGEFHLFTGTIDVDGAGEYNAAALVPPNEEPQMYHKLHLVPFGEYVPFRNTFPLFAWAIGDQVPDDFDPGNAPVIFQMAGSGLRLAPLICFEDTLAPLVRRFALLNAEVLVNVTNDAWFGKSAASRQHLANAIFRTVETRRPLLRAANTGATAFIDPNGIVTHILETPEGGTFDRGFLLGDIPIERNPELTFYVKTGDIISQLCTLVSALALAFAIITCKMLKP